MQSFRSQLPKDKYEVKCKDVDKFKQYLVKRGLKSVCDTTNNIVTVFCNTYRFGTFGVEVPDHLTITPKEFKRIVREALGESK